MNLIERIRQEPVLVTALVQAVLLVLVSFGVDLNEKQTVAILALSGAVLAFVARSKVTPTSKL